VTTHRRFPSLLAVFALLACGGEQPAPDNGAAMPRVEESGGNAAVIASAAPARCAPALTPQVDRDSIVEALAGGKVDAARLGTLSARAGAAFSAAAERLCHDGRLDPKLLRPFSTLIVLNGSGATEATFYEDPHEFRSEDLIFQWIFAESDLEVPPADDIETGLLCWAKPDRPECADREP
jgi:hypothetical protein